MNIPSGKFAVDMGGGPYLVEESNYIASKNGGTKMKIKYCRRYSKYVSQQHCEFFNEGRGCDYYSPAQWNSIKDLSQDEHRPQREVDAIIKPFKCNLMDRQYRNVLNRKRPYSGRLLGAQI
jgi:hypothetical protein